MLNTYSQILDLDKRSVFIDLHGDDKTYFNVLGVYNNTFGFGKHSFNISYDDFPDSNYRLKDYSQILFEIKDVYGTVIYSGNTEHVHVNGSSIAYFYIKEDPLRSVYDIANGPATLTIVGELDGVPQEWQNTYNLRLTIPFNIKKNYVNQSDIVFVNQPTMTIGQQIKEQYNFDDYGGASFTNTTHDILSIDNLNTYGGEVKYLDVSYRHSSSISQSDDYIPLGIFDVDYDNELLTPSSSIEEGTYKIGFFDQDGANTDTLIAQNWKTSSAALGGKFDTSEPMEVPGGITINNGFRMFRVVRKAITDEEYKLRLNLSGSGFVGIWSSPVLSDLEDNSNARLNPAITQNFNAWSSSVSQSVYKSIGTITSEFGEFASKYPTIDGKAQSGSNGHWDEFTFSIPSGSWFTIGLGAAYKGTASQRSASFGQISIKHRHISGTNPPSFYITPQTRLPQNTPYEEFEYKVNFLNLKKEPALNVTSNTYPIIDYNTTGSSPTTGSSFVINRRGNSKALVVENYSEVSKSVSGWNNGITIQAWAGPSGSDSQQVSVVGTYAVVAQANVDDNKDYGNSRYIAGLYSHTTGAGTGHNYSSSAWVGIFGTGDVNIQNKLAIGSFDITEHPSASLHVKGDIIAENYIVSSTVSYITTSFSSGSTKFGDSTDDTHQFTGSLHMSGSTTSSFQTPNFVISGNLHLDNGNETVIFMNDKPSLIHNRVTKALSIGYITDDVDHYRFTGGKSHLIYTASNLLTQPSFTITGSTGNVGIGNLYPPSKLTVAGVISSSGGISSSADIKTTGNIFLPSGAGMVGFNTSNHIEFEDGKTKIHQGGGSLVQFTNTGGGNVGVVIGNGGTHATDPPITGLTVMGAISSSGDAHVDELYSDGGKIYKGSTKRLAIGSNNLIYGDASAFGAQTTLYSYDSSLSSGNKTHTLWFTTNAVGYPNAMIQVEAEEAFDDTNGASSVNIHVHGQGTAADDSSEMKHVLKLNDGGAFFPTGYVSGSATSTGSFGHLMVGGGNFSSASLAGGGGGVSNYADLSGIPNNIVSSSTQIDALGFLKNNGDSVVSSSTQIDALGFLKVSGDSVISSSAQVTYGSITGVPSNIVSSSTQIDNLGFLKVSGDNVVSNSAQINHDSTTNFVANEHIDHSSVSITAGAGLNGGGTIASTRTLSVDSASMGGFYSGSMNDFTTTGTGSFGHVQATGDISASGTGIFNKLEIHGADGTLVADYILHKNDSNTKFGFPQADKFKIRTDGDDRYVVDTTHSFTGNITADSNISSSATSTGSFGQGHFDGKVGIGTTSPGEHLTVHGNISASGGTFTGNFPDTNDNAHHFPIVVDSQNGTLESQNSLKVNPSTNEITVGSLKATTHITASQNISASGIINAEQFHVKGEGAITYQSNTGHLFPDSSVQKLQIGKVGSVTETNIEGHITSSGDISGSGKLFISGAHIADDVTIYGGRAKSLSISSSTHGAQIEIDSTVTSRQKSIYFNSGNSTKHIIELYNDNLGIGGSDTFDTILSISGSGNSNGAVAINTANSSTDVIPQALTVEGNISASGAFMGKLIDIKNSGFYLSNNHTSRNFIPLAGSLSEGTTDQYYQMIIAPYNGRLVKVFAHAHFGNPGTLTTALHTGSYNSAAHLESSPVQEISRAGTVDDTTYVFHFTSSIAKFDEGDMIGITLKTSNTNNGSYTVTSVWEYDTAVDSFSN